MKNREATALYQKSKQLFSEKKYDESLKILDELYARFPEHKNVCYARILTLAKLKRYNEALALCEQARTAFRNDRRFEKLCRRIQKKITSKQISGTPSDLLAELEDWAEEGGVFKDIEHHLADGYANSWASYLVWGGVIFAVLLICSVIASFIFSRTGKENSTLSSQNETISENIAGEESGLPDAIQWIHSATPVYQEGSTELKPRLFFFRDPSDDIAREIERDVFGQDSIVQLLEDVECYELDTGSTMTDDTKELMQIKQVTEIPSIIIEDVGGRVLYRHSGPLDVRDFYDELIKLDLRKVNLNVFPPYFKLQMMLYGLLLAPWPLYFTLLIVRKLPHESFLQDLLPVSIAAIGADIVGSFTCQIGQIFILNKIFDMQFIDFIIFYFFKILTYLLLSLIAFSIVGPKILDIVQHF